MDKSEKKNSSSAWELIGKIGVLLGIIVAFLTITAYLTKNTAELHAIITYHSYALPPDLLESLSKVHDIQSKYDFLELFRKENSGKNNIPDENLDALSTQLERRFNELWGDKFEYSFNHYRSFSSIVVYNEGEKPAIDVILDIPTEGVALITFADDSQDITQFKKNINIKQIRQNNSVSIAIWSSDKLSYFSENDFNLTHKEGTGKISFGKTVYGVSKLIDDQKFLFFYFLTVLLAFSLAILFQPLFKKLKNIIWPND